MVIDPDAARPRWQVFLSSTFKEMRNYRDAVHEAYENDLEIRSRVQLIEMEDALPSTEAAEKYCEGLVRGSDLILLVLGNQLGSPIPPEEKWTYTEWEFFTAREIGLPLLFVPLTPDASGLEAAAGPPDPEMVKRCADLRQAAATQGATRPGDRLLEGMQDPEGMATHLMGALRQWLDNDATPTRIGGDRRFVGHRDEYRRLRASIFSRRLSLLAGPPGAGKSALAEALKKDPDVGRRFWPIVDIPIVADYQTSPAELQRKILGSVLTELSRMYGLAEAQDSLSADLDALTVAITSAIAGVAEDGAGAGAPSPLVLVRIGAIWGGNDPDDGRKNVRAIAKACLSLPALVTTIVETSDERMVKDLLTARQLNPGDVIRPTPFSAEEGLEFLYSLGDGGRAGEVLHHFDRDTGIPCALCADGGKKLSEHLGGSPQLLAIAGRALRREKIHDDLPQIDQLLLNFVDLEEIGYETLKLAVSRLGESERAALIAASVLLPKPYAFSASAVAAMCSDGCEEEDEDDDEDEDVVGDWREALEHLQDRCLIEPGAASGDQGFKMHPNISFGVRHWCETEDDLPRLKTSRDRGFQFYDKEMITFLENSSLRGWYGLENAVWDGSLLDWLHLLMYADGGGKDIGGKMEALVRLYLKAHWWWGGYIVFPLSDDLVDFVGQRKELLARQARRDDGSKLSRSRIQALADTLDGFDRDYPKLGDLSIPPTPPEVLERWSRVADHVARVARLLRIPMSDDGILASDPEESDSWRAPMRAEIREYLHVFRAHAARFGCGVHPLPAEVLGRVDGCYQVAIELATKSEDLWNQGWYQMECADAWFDAMELEAAWTKAHDAEATVRRYEGDDDDNDYEVRANIERLYGDIRWEQGDRTQAWDHYVRALYYALGDQLYPHCDPYTVRFYEEQMWRASGRLFELEMDRDRHQAVSRMRQAFGLDDVPDAELAALLAGPDSPSDRKRMEALYPETPAVHRWTEESDDVAAVKRRLEAARRMFPDLLTPREGYR